MLRCGLSMSRRSTPGLLAAVLTVSLSSGCQFLGPAPGPTEPPELPATAIMQESLDQTARVPAVPGRALPEAVSEALLPPIRLSRPGAVRWTSVATT